MIYKGLPFSEVVGGMYLFLNFYLQQIFQLFDFHPLAHQSKWIDVDINTLKNE